MYLVCLEIKAIIREDKKEISQSKHTISFVCRKEKLNTEVEDAFYRHAEDIGNHVKNKIIQ